MSKKVGKKAKKAVPQKFWAVRSNDCVNIYRASTRPSIKTTEWEVKSASGSILYPLIDLCEQATPLFKDLSDGEIREVTVILA